VIVASVTDHDTCPLTKFESWPNLLHMSGIYSDCGNFFFAKEETGLKKYRNKKTWREIVENFPPFCYLPLGFFVEKRLLDLTVKQ